MKKVLYVGVAGPSKSSLAESLIRGLEEVKLMQIGLRPKRNARDLVKELKKIESK